MTKKRYADHMNDGRTYKKQKESIDLEKSSKISLLDDSSQAARRIATLAQVTAEIIEDKEHMALYKSLIGEDGVAIALNLGHVLRSKQSTAPPKNDTKATITEKAPLLNRKLESLPNLPFITDRSLMNVPFTHEGVINTASASKTSYERLELLGDAYIELISTRLIFSHFPHYSSGRMSQVRESLVKNETLSQFSLAYKFDEKARLPDSYRDQDKEMRKLWIKSLGDIFEAYVAAVILSDPQAGFSTAETWLTALWSPMLLSEKATPVLNVDAKAELARKIMGRFVKTEFRDEGPEVAIRNEGKVIYSVGAYLTGWGWKDQYLGGGEGLSKKEAGTRAAMAALLNPLTAQIAAIKREYDRKVKEERELAVAKEGGGEDKEESLDKEKGKS